MGRAPVENDCAGTLAPLALSRTAGARPIAKACAHAGTENVGAADSVALALGQHSEKSACNEFTAQEY